MSEKLYQDFRRQRQIPLTVLGGQPPYQTRLIQDAATGKILVQKAIQKDSIPVYRKLQQLESQMEKRGIQTNIGNLNRDITAANRLMQSIRQMVRSLKGWLSDLKEKKAVLLEALEQIHAQGIVHRDISPKNVLISTDGVVKLLDFDIARRRKRNQNADTTILGTVGFASPEQYGFLQTDATADIYALGVLMNVMLEGTLPNVHLTARKPFCNVIKRCIEIDPQNRYQNAGELREALKLENPGAVKKKTILPGFRTGVVWKEIVAVFVYLFLIVGSIQFLMLYGKTPLTFCLEAIAVFIYAWISCGIGFNFLLWDTKVPGIRSLQKPVRIIIRIILALTIFYLGMKLENYVKITLLGLPLK